MADAATIIAVVGGITGAVGGGGGLLAVYQAWHQGRRENRQDIWGSFREQIASAEARNDTDEIARVRKDYEAQQEAWRAQQGVERLAPRDISREANSSLSERDVARLRQLLEASRGLLSSLTADEHFLRGNAYYEAADYEAALSSYNRSLALRPDHPDTLYNRGVTLDHLERYDDALAAYDRALELRPDDPATLNNRGAALDKLDRHEEALADYNRSLTLRPDDPATLNNRGNALGELGRHEEALADYNRSLALRPDDADTLNNRGVVLGKLRRHEEALADYNRALELRPDDPDTIYNRACLHSLSTKPVEALDDLRAAIAGDAKYREMARTDPDFDNIRDDPRFRELVGDAPEDDGTTEA